MGIFAQRKSGPLQGGGLENDTVIETGQEWQGAVLEGSTSDEHSKISEKNCPERQISH